MNLTYLTQKLTGFDVGFELQLGLESHLVELLYLLKLVIGTSY